MQKTKVGGPGHREVKPTKRIKPHEINLKQAAPAEDSEPASSGVPKFGQRLASNDKETRDKAVKTLTRYLKSGPVLEELDLAKIWKALFYCMWHADKPKVQNELAERLGAMVLAVPGNKATLFAKTFFAMMMREWPGIDRLRLNKFYTLLKCVLKNSLRQLHRAGWPAGGAEGLAEVLQLGPLSSRSPPGLRYWLVDNLVPALVAELKAEVRTEVVMALLEPLFIALGDAVDPHSLQRTTDAVDALLEALKPEAEAEAEAMEDDASGEEEESAPRLQAKLPLPLLAERLFGLASAKRTRETNRTHLYALQQRVEALATASGEAPAVAAPAVGAPAVGKALAAPRADPVQVDALRRLIGSKAGAKAAAKAGAKAGGKAVREAEPGSGAPGTEAAPAAATSPPLSASRPKKKKRPAAAEAAEAEVAEAAEAAEAEAAAPKRPKRLKSAGKAAKASAEAAEAEAPEPPPAAKAARAGARKRKA